MSSSIVEDNNIEALRDAWSALSDEERCDAFRMLPEEDKEAFFSSISSDEQASLILILPPRTAAVWMRLLAPDDAADLLRLVDPEERYRLRCMLDQHTQQEVEALLAYADDEAGGLMSPRFVRMRADVTVEVAIRYLRRQTRNNAETLYYIYVLDSEQRLQGVLSLRELFSAPEDVLVSDIMNTDPVAVSESMDQEEVAHLIELNNLLAVPVIDEERRMKGIITVDDIVDVIREEATEDIQRLGGSEVLGAPYLKVSFLSMIKKRGGWLSVLFMGEMLTATAMGSFEDEIAKAVVLAMFVPLIISSGGNSGSQAATLIVRSLALSELQSRDWLRVLGRELRSGLTLGGWLGFIGFLRVEIWQELGILNYGPHVSLIALTVWISLMGVVTFGTVVGSMLPFILRRAGFDPATSSAPFVATLVDVTGLIIYFTVAAILLRGTLL